MKFYRTTPSVRAFTLVEVLVTVSIIAILVSLLLPSLGAARRSAMAMSSSMTLSAMGRSMMMHAEQDENGRFCTGSFDHIRDGDVRQRGWVNDMIEMAVINPGKSLDPSSQSRISRTVAEYTGMLTDDFSNVQDGYYWIDQADALSNVMSSTEAEEAIEQGYNTNYVATWHLTRGDPVNPNFSSYKDATDTAQGTPDDGMGALSASDLTNARTNVHNIPLISEGRVTTSSVQAVDSEWLGTGSTISMALESIGFKETSKGLVDSRTGGMNAYKGTGAHPGTAANRDSTNAESAWEHDYSNFWPKQFGKRSDQVLPSGQVLLDWFVSGYANVLFSDGHVGKIQDRFGIDGQPDGFLGAYPTSISNGAFVDMIADGEDTLWGEKVLLETNGS